MPSKPHKPCAHASCPNLTATKYCEAHADNAKREARDYNRYQRDPGTAKRYNGEWRKIRARFLASNPLCEMCQCDGRLTPATLVHHKRKLTDGGSNEWSNLQALCSGCHSRLHSQQGDRWG